MPSAPLDLLVTVMNGQSLLLPCVLSCVCCGRACTCTASMDRLCMQHTALQTLCPLPRALCASNAQRFTPLPTCVRGVPALTHQFSTTGASFQSWWPPGIRRKHSLARVLLPRRRWRDSRSRQAPHCPRRPGLPLRLPPPHPPATAQRLAQPSPPPLLPLHSPSRRPLPLPPHPPRRRPLLPARRPLQRRHHRRQIRQRRQRRQRCRPPIPTLQPPFWQP